VACDSFEDAVEVPELGHHAPESAAPVCARIVADVGGLRTVELEDGLLRIELKSGDDYQFPITELLNGERDPILQLRVTTPGHDRAALGGVARSRPHP
jgi:hypothetical protein